MTTYFSQELLNPSDKDEGGTIVYTHNLAQSKILHDFGSTEYGTSWLKLSHPDPIYDIYMIYIRYIYDIRYI